MNTITVALVDDHAVVRAGYTRLLECEGDVHVAAEFGSADAAMLALQRTGMAPPPWDVLVLDISMPGRSGLDFLRRAALRWPMLKVLVFTMHDGAAMVAQCLRAGARGFITKSSPPQELVEAVRQVHAGQIVLSNDIARYAQVHNLNPAVDPVAGQASAAEVAERLLQPAPHAALSGREFDVLRLLCEGRSIDDIAERLTLSSKTIANYQSTIRQKLGVASGIELLRYAQMHGLFGQ